MKLFAQLIKMIKVLGIEHIGIAVKSKNKMSNFFENILGIKNPKLEDVQDQKILTEISAGELLDKISILEIKLKKIQDKLNQKEINKTGEEKKFQLEHLDYTIILQEPKISDYRQEIEKNLSELLCIDEFSVNIKATSTDFLGLIGESEGIAAQSIVTLNSLEK